MGTRPRFRGRRRSTLASHVTPTAVTPIAREAGNALPALQEEALVWIPLVRNTLALPTPMRRLVPLPPRSSLIHVASHTPPQTVRPLGVTSDTRDVVHILLLDILGFLTASFQRLTPRPRAIALTLTILTALLILRVEAEILVFLA